MLSRRSVPEDIPDASRVFLAGHAAPAGTYVQVGGRREIRLEREDMLPASCDGRVAVYVRRTDTWADRQNRGRGGR